MGVSGPPQPKNGHFLPQKRPKNAKIGPTTLFFGLGRSVRAPPPPYFAGARIKKTSFAWYVSRKIGFLGPPHPKDGHFLAKNGLKLPIWAKKQCFWTRVLSSRPPYPIFWVLDTKKHMLHSIEARKWEYQGHPTQKMGIFCSKMA